ncbi:LysM peptidoglycan-binding domain-containing protein [Vibrio sp. JC009]|uniref:LysM peptidoglycan-binding domain-containing protein n=1 Tax=Vibrio sp. JC009 TaxID=2912314 RepID=UPI0023B074B7|nr:LysM peptidoglycan-binding domain-containing protein [Vibrio sp. JC009]WED22957.1 LysM peptidoglycan-binding domain-containing protein [Vibrio sp. JC009]
MHTLIKTMMLSFGVCVTLAGCISTEKEEAAVVEETNLPVEEEVMVEPEPMAQPGLSPSERLRLVLSYLEQGQPDMARIELKEYIATNKKSPRANRLLEQIDKPASSYFPAANFKVTLDKGETLSTLARDYLGDVFSFYALAKYNGIDVPARIDAGQVVKVPSTQHALKYKAELIAAKQNGTQVAPEPAVSEEALLDMAVNGAEEEPVTEMADMAKEVAEEAAESVAEAEPEVVMTPEEKMQAALDQGDYLTAVSSLEAIKQSGGLSSTQEKRSISIYKQAAMQLESSDPKQASAYYYESAKTLIKYGQRESAIPSLLKATQLDANNNKAIGALKPIQREYADRYHSEASIAYRKQELDKAITLWNRVLEIDPEHSAAKAYLAQAKELKTKLSALEDK